MKLSPLELLAPIAMEIERLLSTCMDQTTTTSAAEARGGQAETVAATTLEVQSQGSNTDASASASSSVASALLSQLFTSISQHCEASRRAWLAAWYVELAQLYGSAAVEATGDFVSSSTSKNNSDSNDAARAVVARL